ncbi:hypothetical protein JHK85_004442 [Glycine max]|nr:hypothetical protein JHK85_004442 [Glycine max]
MEVECLRWETPSLGSIMLGTYYVIVGMYKDYLEKHQCLKLRLRKRMDMAKLLSSLPSSSSSNSENSKELVCVGTLEIATPKPVGFLCGSIPVPTDKSFHHAFHSALLPTPQTVNAPRYRYRMLPTETDLNTPPLLANFPDKVLPVGAVHSKATGGDKEVSLEVVID